MEPTFFEVLFQCIFAPLIAITFIFVFFFGILALFDILCGQNPKEESLSMFFEEGAIFGSFRDKDK